MILSRHKIETVSSYTEIKPILDHVFDIFIEKKKKKQLDTNIFNFDFLVVIFIFLASRFNFISKRKNYISILIGLNRDRTYNKYTRIIIHEK